MSEVLGIINRIKITVQLMSELENMKMNYMKILGLTMYLQLETPIHIFLNNYQEPYFACDHQLYNVIQNIDQISLIDGNAEAYMTNTYQIIDTVRGPYYALNTEQYEDLVNSYA